MKNMLVLYDEPIYKQDAKQVIYDLLWGNINPYWEIEISTRIDSLQWPPLYKLYNIIYNPRTRNFERGSQAHFSIGQLRDRKFQFLYCRDRNFLYEVTIITYESYNSKLSS